MSNVGHRLNVAVRLMSAFGSCPAEHHFGQPKHEAVELHTIDRIIRSYSVIVNKALRSIFTIYDIVVGGRLRPRVVTLGALIFLGE
jgi:hypothetical protein